MKQQDNTGLGLIKTTIERVQNRKSLFSSALKKLINSTEDDLRCYLTGRRPEAMPAKHVSLRLISGGDDLRLVELRGKRRIQNLKHVFEGGIDPQFATLGADTDGVVTRETPVQIYETEEGGSFRDIFASISGPWQLKWLSQDQVIEFCTSLKAWLSNEGKGTYFLVPKNENKSIDEKRPGENLVVVRVSTCRAHGVMCCIDRLKIDMFPLERNIMLEHDKFHRAVAPRLLKASLQ